MFLMAYAAFSVYPICILYYFNTRRVKDAFAGTPAEAPAAPEAAGTETRPDERAG